MATVNLNNQRESIIDGKDSIVIVDNFQSIRGGRSLDVTGFTPKVIKAGHVIIKQTSNDEYKPMPVVALGAIDALGKITGGASYTNGTYTDVALTGGSGSGATANITVSGGAVTAVTIVNKGTGYAVGDSLSAATANIGTTGAGFSVGTKEIDSTGAAYGSLPAGHEYAGILIASIPTDKAFAGIMVRGTVNYKACPYSMTSIMSAVKTALPLIDFRAD